MTEEIGLDSEDFDDSKYVDTNEQVDFNRRKDKEISYKQIVLRAIEECRKQGSRQMKRGVEVFIKDKNGNFIPQQLDDQRKVWKECVFQLECLLLFAFDKEAEDKINKCKENIQKIHNKYLQVYLNSETFIPYKKWSQMSGQYHPSSQLTPQFIQYEEEEILNQWRTIYQELLILYKKRKNELSNRRVLGAYEL